MTGEFQKIRTGVIGVGSMGQNHARILSQISDLSGVSDLDEIQGKKIAKRYGTNYYPNHIELLKNIDAVVISVPTKFHCDVALDAVKFDVSMLIEKPLATNIKDSKRILDSANSSSIIATVGHIERHNPVVKYIKKSLEMGQWGDVISVSSKRVSRYPERIKDVGVVFDLAIHDIDIISYLVDSSLVSLYSTGGSIESGDREDHASILMAFENGITGFCDVNWLTPMKVRELTLTCSGAYVIADYIKQEVKVFKSEYKDINLSNLSKVEQVVDVFYPDIIKEEPLKLELLDFLSCVISHKRSEYRKPLVSIDEGLKVVSIAQEVIRTIELKT